MVITKYLCDRCNKEISIEQLNRIGWIAYGQAEPQIEQIDFCADCKEEIMRSVKNKAEDAPTDAPTEAEPSEVIQASGPKRPRNTTTQNSIDRQIAEGMYRKGKPIGEIARSLNRSYQCIRNWVR